MADVPVKKLIQKESITWGARAGGLRVSECFNPQPDLDNANVGK